MAFAAGCVKVVGLRTPPFLPVLDTVLLDNPLRLWLVAAGIAAAVLLLVTLFRRVLVRRLQWLAARTTTRLDNAVTDGLEATRLWLWLLPALYAASHVLVLPERSLRLLSVLATLSLLAQVGLWASRMVDFWSQRSQAAAGETGAAGRSGIAVLRFLGKLVIWAILLLVGLDNLGVDVTAAVAGLGIGGIAVALAMQNILGDLFASLSIVIDKPFEVGDFVISGDHMGTVEEIGLKTTRVRSLSGEQIVFPNSDLLQSRLRNFKRMVERRVAFRFGVLYETAPDDLDGIPPLVQGIVEAQEKARFDRAHLLGLGAASLDYEVVYWVLSPDFSLYADIQQAINLALIRAFAERGIQFAYPTQTLHVASFPQTALQEAADAPE